ncbi:unnamed protein product [Cercopithifilaria johnstoni]|uniref:Uncharacterized protein n=1 Tax=Cercopithifilaria johnstoni TaxID=2874296 RepID=A0A8J2LWE9_9BILA|nr:unnamed protein product [Cercopithifilaria johnstoni]
MMGIARNYDSDYNTFQAFKISRSGTNVTIDYGSNGTGKSISNTIMTIPNMELSIITIKLLARLIAFQLLLLSLLPVTVVTDELLNARCQTMCLHQLEIASGVRKHTIVGNLKMPDQLMMMIDNDDNGNDDDNDGDNNDNDDKVTMISVAELANNNHNNSNALY